MRRTWVGVAVAAMLSASATGCAGGDPGGGPPAVSTPPTEVSTIIETGPTIAEIVESVVTNFGAETAVAAVLYALDDGYSLTQLVPATIETKLTAAGEILGTDPALRAVGLIARPGEPDGFASPRREGASPPVTDSSGLHTPEEVQATITAKLAALSTVNLLGAPLGLGGEFDYADVFGRQTTSDVDETSPEEATAVIGVLVGLLDLGYSFDQALEGWLFGDVEFAIGVDPTGETFTGISLGSRPVAVCLTLRGSDGQVVAPALPAPATMFGSATCASAIRNRTITYDRLGAVRVAGAVATDDGAEPPPTNLASSDATSATTTAPTTTAASAAESITFPRTYRGGGWVTWSFSYSDGSCIVEGNTLEVTLREDGTLKGVYHHTDPTFTSRTPPGGTKRVECGDQVFQYTHDVVGRHTVPNAVPGDSGSVVVEFAEWSGWHIEGDYTATEMSFDWEIAYEATGYDGDAPDPRVIRSVDFDLQHVDP